ncbi:hypothetical protein [Ectropis obliqua nucleopolyhedrovirus]|uniref:Uncharacterized protein n=1 Tax=Ectropis obliqua nucleopolyhedrovirus TaxID=59376 RepID=A0EYT3_9ABAC|nr:hypothetical protein EONV_gp030 [Ectropis obliqua nucleopolyhedrovirus]ABI35714.1 hypothetical protein [Ectropis obliqua nucleopolyhedrovirus]QWV59703.1 hypothetical protein EONV_gp030 [Ectropis obliqua nucleopolyhedrovirus]UYO72823.1 hypothetical protein EONV-gp030 [Ectropis obliqua nucleopolyhedrovirus]
MKNRYTTCTMCKINIYLYKKYSNKIAVDIFFNKYRGINKNNKIYCLQCYNYIFVRRFRCNN